MCFLRFVNDDLHGRKRRAAVRSVAEWLGLGFAAGTPPVFSCFELHLERTPTCDLGFCHSAFPCQEFFTDLLLVANQRTHAVDAEVDEKSGLTFLTFVGEIAPSNGLNLVGISLFLDLGQ